MLILSSIAAVMMAVAVLTELRRDLMMFQQNSYRHERYMKWLRASGDTTSVSRLLALVILFIGLCGLRIELLSMSAMCIYGLIRTYQLVTAKYKKPLVMTARAARIYVTAVTLTLICVAVTLILFSDGVEQATAIAAIAFTGAYCLSHVIILTSGFILAPVEKSINRGYYNDAKSRLESMPDLKIVGITGSYGKTSTKHYLYRILSEHYDTCMTPGSYNTTLGVIRTIREYLKPYNEVFIVEMGAKQTGDIKEICDLVHPTIGIVTAVGPQHLESFHTIENVRDTKFELVDALPGNGLAVINDDFEMISGREVNNTRVVRYAVRNIAGAEFMADDIQYSPQGTTFAINGPDGFSMLLTTRLLGECNISNLLAAVVVAIDLGVPVDKIRYAVSQIEPVEHRLSMKRTAGGLTIIDDAFNSNPSGSSMALDVLSMMTAGERIVITPGMIELGEKQYELNREFGCKIAKSCDYAYIVGQYNRQAILEGITDGGMSEDRVKTFDTFLEAQTYLIKTFHAGDTVLYENDLPDTFK
ncbi:MAG: UDP-N-acetylmuramoyl-tripeptide--D-alanyl-D-alanine ligase [Muribaculaceae bacterium]|nr:UDP-N-acetylmuramoyl-tripeptide--D-alanyl-D-alanine ligase [Muribaculaceae bacterium]